MDPRTEIREFLASRRARLTPAEVGLPAAGRGRRVEGLRREEVALLAGVSPDYYNRLERGALTGASAGVLDSLARALRLDEAERSHLLALARASDRLRSRPSASARRPRVRPQVQAILDALTAPAMVRNGRGDTLAANPLGRAVYAPMFDDAGGTANSARFTFLDERAHDFYPQWEQTADSVVARLRTEAGEHPFDRELTDLVGELCTRSQAFATRWARHDVNLHRSGTKTVNHPLVGRLDLTFETLRLEADPGLTLVVYAARTTSPTTAESLALLASWTAGRRGPPPPSPGDHPQPRGPVDELLGGSLSPTTWGEASTPPQTTTVDQAN